ncbi:PepSY-associated TM helix domain-containing protein [Rhodopseudomonas sp. G2_2311]|uniref:PepSY-associated TM helix domain-containing protein n=1 Tax=Rhodopseudomonas sp. G2_2311 TaxID=3114287 RepID=UPI0039C679D3
MTGTRALRIWSKVHTWTSLISMLFMLMLCLTGLPLIFHEEIEELTQQQFAAPNLPGNVPAAPVDDVVRAAQQARPGDHVLFVTWRDEQPDTVVVSMSPTPKPMRGKFYRLVMDGRTKAVLGEERPQQGVMDIILLLHKNMLLELPGELFLGAMGLLLVVSIVSGVVVYAPFMRRLDFGTVRQRSRRLKWLDLHNLFGIVTTVWLFVVGITGAINTLAMPMYDYWRGQVLPPLLAPYRGAPVAQPSSLDQAIARVRAALPEGRLSSITMPTAENFGSPRHLVVWMKGNSALTALIATPTLVDVDQTVPVLVPQMPWYLTLLQMSRPLHFGDYGGLPLKIVWGLLDLVCIVVLITGLYLWVAKQRFGGHARSRTTTQPAEVQSTDARPA